MRSLIPTRRRATRRSTSSPSSASTPRGPVIESPGGARRTGPLARSTTARRSRASASRARSGNVFRRRRRPSLAARRGSLVVLVGMGLLLLTYSYGRDGGRTLHGPQMQVLRAVTPIERGLTSAWAPVRNASHWIGRIFSAASENPKLRKRIDELEARAAIAQGTEQENARLRDVLALKERGRFPAGFRQITASVIARSPAAIDHSVVIDVGSNDGIKVDDAVMVARGLIGRVEAVSPTSARVGLMVNKTEAVSATVVGSDAQGVLRPVSSDGAPVMELAYVPQRVSVNVGDIVETSGWANGDLASTYPRGVPVGVVSSVGNSPADLYKTVQVTPYADFDRIDTVVVLTADGQVTYQPPLAPNPTRAAAGDLRSGAQASRARAATKKAAKQAKAGH